MPTGLFIPLMSSWRRMKSYFENPQYSLEHSKGTPILLSKIVINFGCLFQTDFGFKIVQISLHYLGIFEVGIGHSI